MNHGVHDNWPLQRLHHRLRSIFAYWLEHRHQVLFYTLLLTLIASPIFATLRFDETPMAILLAVSLTAALVGMRSRHLSHLLLIILLVLFSLRVLAGSIDWHRVIAASTVALVVLGFIAGVDTVRVAMSSDRVTAELLYAALSLYLLVGILFAMLHCAVALAWHDAYSLPAGEHLTIHSGIYFSFITQTTVGYGDILPRSDLARGLAILQAIFGQFYLSVMVARLVSLYLSNRERDAGAA